jgi:opacity protein-like surface antigen
LSPRWFVTGKADLGGGGSKFTYQLFGGVGVNVGKRWALVGGYRDLNVNYDKDGFLFDMSLHGPILGIGMKF